MISLYFDIYECAVLLSEIGTLLSRASHSDALVTRINNADINCEFFTSTMIVREADVNKSEESLRTLIKGIGDYLTRVVGSVPIDLKITLRVYGEMTSVYPRVTFGPLYYEGRGEAMS